MTEIQGVLLNSNSATTTDLTTGYAQWTLQEPIRLYKADIHTGGEGHGIPLIAVSSFSNTNFFINISAALNNNTIYYSDNPVLPEKYSIVIPDGSWSVDSLNSFIGDTLLADQGSILFTITPNYSTNKIGFQFSTTTGWFIYLKTNVSPYTLLGCTAEQFIPASKSSTSNYLEYAPNAAAFNSIESIKVKTNLSNGTFNDTNKSSCLLEVPITTGQGTTQLIEPTHLIWAAAPILSSGVSVIEIRITDQDDNPIVLAENFLLTLLLKA